MAAVDYDQPPPPDLVTMWNCKRWNTLPNGGGYYDQPYIAIQRMNIADNIHSALSKARNAVGKQIHTLTQAERKILGSLREMGLL